MADTVECVRPNCGEVFDPDQTGGSCPSCQTPHPDATTTGPGGDDTGGGGGDDTGSGGDDTGGGGGDDTGSGGDDTGSGGDESKPEVSCPDPDCSGTIAAGADYCSACGTERGTEFDTGGEQGGESGPPTCPNGHEVDPDAQFCPQCGESIPDDTGAVEDEGPPTCPNGHEVDADAQFCPECGESIPDNVSGGASEGPSVTLEIGSQAYDVIEDGEITVDDDEKSADVFGTDARRAAQAEGVDASTARQIHRDYLSFRVDGDDCYVTNEGRNPTKYNGDDFDQDEERQLNDGDTIDLGAGAVTAVVQLDN
ncbi:double zinc ribbon domain-containing protein [Halobellus marinus]|uniref:double zinc ribbon domain-containing protein n=1 Tax=Halobellus TaxID=1073986 RepID=UPI0028B0077B|nr:zinc ribbon domain-containing protein [Halobellus sp. DFY28]